MAAIVRARAYWFWMLVKSLTRMGNSVGLIFDKTLLQILNLGRNGRVKIFTDGKRLILEPAEELFEPARLQGLPLAIRRFSARETLSKLISFGLTIEHMKKLGAGATDPLIYQQHLQSRETADPVLEMVMDRLDLLRTAIDNGLGWFDGVEFARRSIPDANGVGELGSFSELERKKAEIAARRPATPPTAAPPTVAPPAVVAPESDAETAEATEIAFDATTLQEEKERQATAELGAAKREYQSAVAEERADSTIATRNALRLAQARIDFADYVFDLTARGVPLPDGLAVSDFEAEPETEGETKYVLSSGDIVS